MLQCFICFIISKFIILIFTEVYLVGINTGNNTRQTIKQ